MDSTVDSFFKKPKRILDKSTNTSSYYFLKSLYLWNGLYKNNKLLNTNNLLNKEFINSCLYDIFINTLKNKEYLQWLKKIYMIPINNSLKLLL